MFTIVIAFLCSTAAIIASHGNTFRVVK